MPPIIRFLVTSEADVQTLLAELDRQAPPAVHRAVVLQILTGAAQLERHGGGATALEVAQDDAAASGLAGGRPPSVLPGRSPDGGRHVRPHPAVRVLASPRLAGRGRRSTLTSAGSKRGHRGHDSNAPQVQPRQIMAGLPTGTRSAMNCSSTARSCSAVVGVRAGSGVVITSAGGGGSAGQPRCSTLVVPSRTSPDRSRLPALTGCGMLHFGHACSRPSA
jgi:hypothetical protein